MRCFVLATAILCLPLISQGHDHDDGHHPSPVNGGGTPSTTPSRSSVKSNGDPLVHRAQPDLPAEAALQFLRDANARVAAARQRGEAAPDVEPRPAGAGRYVVAVIACADCELDAETLFLLAREDVLWIANAGAAASTDAADLVAWAAREHRVRLCVVLSHARCASLAPPEVKDGRGVPGAERRSAAARALAQRRRISIEEAQAVLQAEQMRAALKSAAARESLDRAPGSKGATAAEVEVRVVAASVEPGTHAVTFHVPRADELPIAPVR